MKHSKQLFLFAAYLFSLYAHTLQASLLMRTRNAINSSIATMRMPNFMQAPAMSSSWSYLKSLSSNIFTNPVLALSSRSIVQQSSAKSALISPLFNRHNNNYNNYNSGTQSNINKARIGLAATVVSTTLLAADEINKYYYGPAIKNDKPVTLFAHGLRQNYSKGYNYYHVEKTQNGFIEGPLVTFNFDYHTNEYKSSLGQDPDIRVLHQACKNYQNVDAVGVSCGASTLFNYLASSNPKNIKSAVIEAAFKSPYDVMKDFERRSMRTGVVTGLIGLQIVSLMPVQFQAIIMAGGAFFGAGVANIDVIRENFPNFNPEGILPKNCAAKMPKEIPILLVCSNEDVIIKNTNSVDLFLRMKSAGHNKVYLLNLMHGEHAGILESQDGETYRNVVHAFYRHHNRPYNKSWAEAGQKRFEQCPGFAAKA